MADIARGRHLSAKSLRGMGQFGGLVTAVAALVASLHALARQPQLLSRLRAGRHGDPQLAVEGGHGDLAAAHREAGANEAPLAAPDTIATRPETERENEVNRLG